MTYVQKYQLFTNNMGNNRFANSAFSILPSIRNASDMECKCIFTEAEFNNVHPLFAPTDYLEIWQKHRTEVDNQATLVATLQPFARKYYSMTMTALADLITTAIAKVDNTDVQQLKVYTDDTISTTGLIFRDSANTLQEFTVSLYGNFLHCFQTAKINHDSVQTMGYHEVLFPGIVFIGPTVYQIHTNLDQYVKVCNENNEEHNIVLMTDNLTSTTNTKVQMFGSMVCKGNNLSSLKVWLTDEYENEIDLAVPIHLELTVYAEPRKPHTPNKRAVNSPFYFNS